MLCHLFHTPSVWKGHLLSWLYVARSPRYFFWLIFWSSLTKSHRSCVPTIGDSQREKRNLTMHLKLEMFTLFPLKQTELAFSHTVGNIHHGWSPWHLANGGGGCPQIPCNKNPLQWHWPWILNGTVHHKRKSDGNYVSSVKNLGEASRCSCHCCHWKPSWYQCHIVWEYWSVNCAEVCCCYWRCSFCISWNFH